MSASLIYGLRRLVGSFSHVPPGSADLPRIGHLIVDQAYFIKAFDHLGRKSLKSIIRVYDDETYANVHPDTLIAFLEAVMAVDRNTKIGERIHLLLDTVVRIVTQQRDRHHKRLSLYTLMERLSLSGLSRLQGDQLIPKALRDTLKGYLDGLPGYRDAMFFEERLPVSCFTHHQVQLKPIQHASSALGRRSLVWLKRQLDTAGNQVRDPDSLLQAHKTASHLIRLNRRYVLLDEEDLIAQLLLRGFSEKLYSIINPGEK